MDDLDEVPFRTGGVILAVESGERFTDVRMQLQAADTGIELVGIYDTALAGQAFPAVPGEGVTLYGVGTSPATVQDDAGSIRRLPKMQILILEGP